MPADRGYDPLCSCGSGLPFEWVEDSRDGRINLLKACDECKRRKLLEFRGVHVEDDLQDSGRKQAVRA